MWPLCSVTPGVKRYWHQVLAFGRLPGREARPPAVKGPSGGTRSRGAEDKWGCGGFCYEAVAVSGDHSLLWLDEPSQLVLADHLPPGSSHVLPAKPVYLTGFQLPRLLTGFIHWFGNPQLVSPKSCSAGARVPSGKTEDWG